MSYTPGLVAWELAFQKSPILLTGGILKNLPGATLPIIAITEAINFPFGLLTGGLNISMDSFFADFLPLPGSTLINQDIGRYPFANQQVAANATIAQPLQISYLMVCPVKTRFGMYSKLPTMLAMVEALKQHNQSGGTYTCVTPSYIYTNCVMRGMSDASTANSKQLQNTWQLDFEKPLVTLADAEQAQNGLMSMLTSGGQIPGNPDTVAWSGLSTGAQTPASVATPSIITASTSAVSANTAAAGGGAIAPFGP